MDAIRETWLRKQYVEGMQLAGNSDILSLTPVGGTPPDRYLAKFDCAGLVRTEAGIAVAPQHLIGIWFPENYLREPCHPGMLLSWLEPRAIWHPNIRPPLMCAGNTPVGMSLVHLLHQIYAIVTFRNVMPNERDSLNPEACAWARQNLDKFPIDPRRSLQKTSADSPPAARRQETCDD